MIASSKKILTPTFLLLFSLGVGSATASAELISKEKELKLGAEAAAKFEKKYPPVQDAKMQERIKQLGAKIIKASGHPDLTWKFTAIQLDSLNAVAFPGGYIYASKKLMEAMPEPELVFVLGHEASHATHRHSVRQIEKNLYTKAGIFAITSLVTGGRRNTTSNTISGLANTVASSQYSQSDEREADFYGIDYMAKAGYDPVFAVSSLKILQREKKSSPPGFINGLVGSHPLTSERISRASWDFIDTGYGDQKFSFHSSRAPSKGKGDSFTPNSRWQNELAQWSKENFPSFSLHPMPTQQQWTQGQKPKNKGTTVAEFASDQGLLHAQDWLATYFSQNQPQELYLGVSYHPDGRHRLLISNTL